MCEQLHESCTVNKKLEAYIPGPSNNIATSTHSSRPLDLKSKITQSYDYRGLPLTWAATRNMIPFNPYILLSRAPREESILKDAVINPLHAMAKEMSLCDFFSKPDCTRFEETWKSEEELGCRNVSASTINDLVLPIIKSMNYRKKKSTIWTFIFNCLLEAYRLQIDDQKVS